MAYFIPVAPAFAGPGPQSVLLLRADAMRIYHPLFSPVLLRGSARCHPNPADRQIPGPVSGPRSSPCADGRRWPVRTASGWAAGDSHGYVTLPSGSPAALLRFLSGAVCKSYEV